MKDKKFTKFLSVVMALVLCFSAIPANRIHAADTDAVTCAKLDTPDALQNYIDTNGAYSSRDTLAKLKEKSGVHKISVDEPGWLFIRSYYSHRFYGECYLYTNASLTNRIGKSYCSANNEENLIACYVQEGNYYYQNYRWNDFTSDLHEATNYVGFMPASQRIKVKKITYSKDKSTAYVSFDYDEDAFAGFFTDTIRVIKKDVPYTKLTDNTTWQVDNRANALTKNSFTAKSNGTYTARITSSDKYFCMVTFEIKGLKSSRPAAPKITTYKKGTRTVKGSGKANTKVYVTVKGKTYSANVSASGSWKITVKSSLKKGQKISAYIKNTAGTKSAKTSRTVK